MGKNLGTISIGSPVPNPKSGDAPDVPSFSFKIRVQHTHFCYSTAHRNEILGAEQPFTVFLHGKAASRPFKLTSAMEFFLRNNTFKLFQWRAIAPLAVPMGAHAGRGDIYASSCIVETTLATTTIIMPAPRRGH